MNGVPTNPVPCEVCGAPGYPKNGRCRAHQAHGTKYPFDEAKDAIVRSSYIGAKNAKKLTLAINDAVRRIGYPRYMILTRAKQLGLTFNTRHPWTAQELKYLEENAGVVPVKAMTRRLPHSWASIQRKCEQLRLQTAVREGMSANDLRIAFGVHPETIAKWEARGLLKRWNGRFTDVSVRAFVERHPELYDLRRVDQDWFKALLFPSAPCFLPQISVRSTADDYREREALRA